jgi:radical SAM protein with 4Fe4S-binding SPASM domain
MDFKQAKQGTTESSDIVTSDGVRCNKNVTQLDVEYGAVLNYQRQKISDGFEMLKELNGKTLDQLVMVAVGMTHSQFRDAMIEKGQQRYFMPTQNSDRCSQHCSHCFMTERDCLDKGFPISESDLKILTQKFVDRGYKTHFYYQEPIMRPDYFDGVAKFPQTTSEINPAFFVLKKGLVERAKQVGITTIRHSVHGDQESHCSLTKVTPRFYRQILDGIDVLKSNGFKVDIETTIYQDNRHCIDYLADLLENKNVDGWYVGRAVPVGAAKSWPSSKFLRNKDARQVASEVVMSARAHKNLLVRFDANWGPNFFSSRHYKYLLGTIPEEPLISSYWCDAINTCVLYASVETGRVYPCFYHISFEDEAIGKYDRLKCDIQFDDEKLQKWTIPYLSKNLRGICSKDSCMFHDLCLGGCRGAASAFARFDGDPDPFTAGADFCLTHELMGT